jgi:hypothetical protein
MQRVQTASFCGFPSTTARTLWRFGIRRVFETLCAWLIVFPVCGPLPQIAHTFANVLTPLWKKKWFNIIASALMFDKISPVPLYNGEKKWPG